jgi:hypothetical protein
MASDKNKDELYMRVKIDNKATDFLTLLIYPMWTLEVNRSLDTVISRKKKQTMISDLRDMY